MPQVTFTTDHGTRITVDHVANDLSFQIIKSAFLLCNSVEVAEEHFSDDELDVFYDKGVLSTCAGGSLFLSNHASAVPVDLAEKIEPAVLGYGQLQQGEPLLSVEEAAARDEAEEIRLVDAAFNIVEEHIDGFQDSRLHNSALPPIDTVMALGDEIGAFSESLLLTEHPAAPAVEALAVGIRLGASFVHDAYVGNICEPNHS